MTSDQLSQLKLMSPGEIARKYTPLMIHGKITREQFDGLIKLGRVVESPVMHLNGSRSVETNESVDTASQFTTHDNEAVGKSQKERMRLLLSDGLWHPTPEIQQRVYGGDHLGRANIPARILDLKKDGYQIESEKVQGSVWKYRLNK